MTLNFLLTFRAHVKAFHAKTAGHVSRYTERTTSNVTAARETLENTAMVR